MMIPPADYPLDLTEAEAAMGFLVGTFTFGGSTTRAVVLDRRRRLVAVKALPADAGGAIRYGIFRDGTPVGATSDVAQVRRRW